MCTSPGITCVDFLSHSVLSAHDWTFVAFAYSSITDQGTFCINNTFGIKDTEGSYFKFNTNGWFSKSALGNFLRIGSDINNQNAFFGEISCLQISNSMLTISQIYQLSKICHVNKDYQRAKPCPPGFKLLNRNCYRLSSAPLSFTDAEISCISEPNSLYVTRLAYPEFYVTMEILLSFAKSWRNVTELYVGLDSISGENRNNPCLSLLIKIK